MSIKNKIIGLLVILIFFTSTSIGIFTYQNSSKIIKNNVLNSNEELTSEISDSVKDQFKYYMNGLKMISINENTKSIPEKGLDNWRRSLFKTYTETFTQAYQIFIGLDDGRIFIEPDYKFNSSYDPRKRTWYEGSMKNQSEHWSGIYKDAVTGNFAVSGSLPVKNNDGKIIGVIGTSLNLNVLSKKITNIKVGKEGYVFLVDESGKVISHPDKNQIGKELPISELLKIVKDKKESGIIDYKYKDSNNKIEPKYAVYKKLEGLNWYVMTSVYKKEVTEQTNRLIFYIFLISSTTLLIAIAIGIKFSFSITKPIAQIVDDMDKVSLGDLTIISKIESKDEIGKLSSQFNLMVKNVRGLILNALEVANETTNSSETLASTSEQVSHSSDEVARTISEIAKGATDQAHDLEGATKIVSSFDNRFIDLKDNSTQIQNNAKEAQKINQSGINAVNTLKERSSQNYIATNEVAKAIDGLSDKSSQIGGILETIHSIAEQTNLLSLNASIEAARAGESGKGFAVVADAIRKLADGSSSSAERIQEIVLSIQNQTQNTVDIMNRLKENAKLQSEAVGFVNIAFENILESVEAITSQIDNINNFILALTNDKDNLVESITSVASVSQETAAASQEVSASMDQQASAVDSIAESAEILKNLSNKLKYSIEQFKV